jgi:hypothetical protein
MITTTVQCDQCAEAAAGDHVGSRHWDWSQ